METIGGKIAGIHKTDDQRSADPRETVIDLNGFLMLPGLVNAHDHLQYGLHPRLGNPPYHNYLEWGEDIHATLPAAIGHYNAVPRDTRIWWGGIRNLLSGVTTVCHHDKLWPCLQENTYPLNVVRDCGWAHSLALGGDVQTNHSLTPLNMPFIVHTCEGIDELAKQEIFELHRLGVLNSRTVIVHGLGLDAAGVALMCDCQASLVICMSSNHFLFERLPDMGLLRKIGTIAIGNDSPLTAAGDLLDEVRFAIEHGGVTPECAYIMVTEAASSLLRLANRAGTIEISSPADLMAVRDIGGSPAERLRNLTWKDVECVTVAGRVQLASDDVLDRLSPTVQQGLEPMMIEGIIRWVRAPINALLQNAEEVLGEGCIRLGGRTVTSTPSLHTRTGPVDTLASRRA